MDDDDFTFAVVKPLAPAVGGCDGGGGGGVVVVSRSAAAGQPYPVFGRPRSPPRKEPSEPTTATARVPLGRLLMVDPWPSSPSQQPRLEEVEEEDDGGLDDVEPARTYYCPWCPGLPAAGVSPSPARCRKSGSTGSLLRWRQLLIGRSQSDGKEKFVFLNTSPSGRMGRISSSSSSSSAAAAAVDGSAMSYYAAQASGRRGGAGSNGGGGRWRSFLPYKQDLVGLFANATVFRRSYHPF